MKTEQKYVRHNTPRKRFQISFPLKGKTKQSFRDQCDINKIMDRHLKTGQIAHVNNHQPQYGYATSLDFTQAMRLVTQAQDMFDGLPSTIKDRFNNNPAQFLDFAQDANNADEMQDLGLLPKLDSPGPKEPETPPEDTPEEKTDKTPEKEQSVS